MGTTLNFDMRYNTKLGSVLVPEQIYKVLDGGYASLTVTYPLNKDMGLLVPCIIVDGSKISLLDLSKELGLSYVESLEHCKNHKYDLYYELTDITYFCRHSYKETPTGVKSNVQLYMPLDRVKKQLKVADVTYTFPLSVRNLLNERYLPYVKNKL